MYVPLAFQCVYGCSDDRNENEDEKDGSKIFGKGGKMGIAWFLVCRLLGFVHLIRKGSESDGIK